MASQVEITLFNADANWVTTLIIWSPPPSLTVIRPIYYLLSFLLLILSAASGLSTSHFGPTHDSNAMEKWVHVHVPSVLSI